ncbi:hypothetical protein ACLOJK_016422 [Asimina triloba]
MKYFSCKSKSSVAVSKPKIKIPKRKPNNTNEDRDRLLQFRHFSYEELESATNGFSPKNLLGKGSHGSVYRAAIDGGKLVVAVKKTTAAEENYNGSSGSFCGSNNPNNPIDNEIEILSRIHNLGFVNLVGYSVDASERRLVVVEFMAKGSLHEHLHGERSPPGWTRRVRFALQIAKAVEALHLSEPPVIHRDIKSSNVLIDGKWNARLGDFGLALRGHVEDIRIRSTPPAGTMGYLDPGYITPENLSTKSDVFSFGILLLEILTGRNAIDVKYSPHSIVDWAVPVVKQSRWDSLYDTRIGPPKDHLVRRQLAALASRCVRSEAERRPSMSEVVNCLRTLHNRVCNTIWGNLTNLTRNSNSSSSSVIETNEDFAKASKNSSGISLRIRRISNLHPGVGLGVEHTSTVVDCSGCKSAMREVSAIKAEQRILK